MRRALLLSEHQHRMSSLVAYVDSGSLGNPGPSGIEVVIDRAETGRIETKKWIGHQDNNVAEYVALEVLRTARCGATAFRKG